MPSKELLISPDDFGDISNAFAIIGQVDELPSSFTGFTGIIRDEKDGRIKTEERPGDTILSPEGILEQLKNLPSYIAETNRVTSENIELVAALGMRALEGLSQQKKDYSKTALLGLQRALKNIGQKTAISLIYSNLPKKESAHGLASLNQIVNPNPRLANYYAQKNQAEAEQTD